MWGTQLNGAFPIVKIMVLEDFTVFHVVSTWSDSAPTEMPKLESELTKAISKHPVLLKAGTGYGIRSSGRITPNNFKSRCTAALQI